ADRSAGETECGVGSFPSDTSSDFNVIAIFHTPPYPPTYSPSDKCGIPRFPRFHQYSEVPYASWLATYTYQSFKDDIQARPDRWAQEYIDHGHKYFHGLRAWRNAIDKWHYDLRFARDSQAIHHTLTKSNTTLYPDDPNYAASVTMQQYEHWCRNRRAQDEETRRQDHAAFRESQRQKAADERERQLSPNDDTEEQNPADEHPKGDKDMQN
ncbi:hypothetical protein HDU76_011983, partial [Blyttiomyces sp. JEL0837]